jgi:hypothetical protein
MPSVKKRAAGDDAQVKAAAKSITEGKFKNFLEMIIAGTPRTVALASLDIGSIAMQAFLLINPDKRELYEEARLTFLRAKVPYETYESICLDIAMGKTVTHACFDHGVQKQDVYKLTLADPSFREMYDEARQIQAEGMVDDIIDISDDKSRDLTGLKTNFDVINRSALKVKTRQWIMSKMNYAKYGDRVQQDIEQTVTVNHAEELDAARRRKEAAHAARNKPAAPKPAPVPVGTPDPEDPVDPLE